LSPRCYIFYACPVRYPACCSIGILAAEWLKKAKLTAQASSTDRPDLVSVAEVKFTIVIASPCFENLIICDDFTYEKLNGQASHIIFIANYKI